MILSIRTKQIILLLSYVVFCVFVKVANADDIKVAVASNFLQPMNSLAYLYEKETGQKVRISSGSTGKLYAQIVHGAPYDIFFAANAKEPEKLEEDGYIVKGSRTTYAVGKIVLWSKKLDIGNTQLKNVLNDKSINTLAIANPKTAPYGAAAVEVMQNLQISLKDIRVIRGENINQTWQFLQSGNADIGFIAASQIISAKPDLLAGNFLKIPENLYTAIEQQAVLISKSKNISRAKGFMKFLRRDDIKQRIEKYGYILPDSSSVAMR